MKRSKLAKITAYKTGYHKLLFAVHLKWAESCGYFDDGYQNCGDEKDPLYPYYPSFKEYQSLIRTKDYRGRKREAFSRG